MIDQTNAQLILDAATTRRAERRRFLKFAGSAAAVGGGLALSSCFGGGDDDDDDTPAPTPSPSPTPTPTGSALLDVLNFALQLEYIEAQFYSFAATGAGLPDALLAGAGTLGAVTGGRQVAFTDPVVAAYAREIAADERAHVAFLRSVLGTAAVAMPAINIDGSATGAFTAAARAAGVVGATSTFDPYASDELFLLGAYIFEDVGVTAYKGAAPVLVSNDAYLEAAAGLLAAEAYHAGLIRTALFQKGLTDQAGKISDARDLLDGTRTVTDTTGTYDQLDLDQGITAGTPPLANIAPTDGNGLVFSRAFGQVLNIVYLNKASTTSGGFFPAGLNGNLNASTANA